MPEVYIIIVNYKNWQDTVECLESLFSLQYKNFKAIVVDNNSMNNSLEHLMEWANNSAVFKTAVSSPAAEQSSAHYIHYTTKDLPTSLDAFSGVAPLVFIQNETNSGFAKGNNLALQLLLNQDAYVWLLNPDMTVQPDTLTRLLQFIKDQPFKSITGCAIKNYLPPHEIDLYGGGKINFNSATVDYITNLDDLSKVDYMSGGSMFTHTRHFIDIGLLPEEYFLYWEETDWCYQARQKGYAMTVCTDAVCYDKISATIGKGYLADYYYTRNGLLFLSKYKRHKLALALFFAILRFLKKMLRGEWGRAKGVYKGAMAFLNKSKR
jgi:GT2 family glycosyltransferase